MKNVVLRLDRRVALVDIKKSEHPRLIRSALGVERVKATAELRTGKHRQSIRASKRTRCL
jgi:hypothetical protein